MFHHFIEPRLDWVLFLLIYFETWLNCTGQSYCNLIPTDITWISFVDIEPIEISSGGEAVKISYNTASTALTWKVDKIEFELASTPGPIINCKTINITMGIQLIINCDTTPVSSSLDKNYEFNSSLNLVVKFGSQYTLGVIDIQCNETQSTPNRARFVCKYFLKTKVEALELDVKINGKKYKKIPCNVFPAPVLNSVVGSTFGGANNPIFIIGNHFNAAFDKYIYLKTNLTSRSKCILVNSTCIRCLFGLGVTPVKGKTQFPFTIFFNELTEFTNQALGLTVNPNPIITSISYSFTQNLLYTNIIHFNPYYKSFTYFRIFDPNREGYMSCNILDESQYYYQLVCRPWAKLAEKGFNRVHVNINISDWMISYKIVVRYQDGPDYQLILTYSIMTVSVFVILALITYFCCLLAKPSSPINGVEIASKSLVSIISVLMSKREEKSTALQDVESSKVDEHKSPKRLANTKMKEKVESEKTSQRKRRRKSVSKSKGKEKRRK
uniref:IPT/TIG domain-containing protein n=1 Tax=Tetranychus urticae TaxID=32264 RepID=T1KDU0_TETUR